jgi:magnesium-transporting ATPase (P-type)
VQCASDLNCCLAASGATHKEVIKLGRRERIRIRELFKFSSEKKRMTIIVQLPNELVLTLTKGSDVSVRECLSEEHRDTAETQAGFAMAAELASRGLRVLSLSYKVL